MIYLIILEQCCGRKVGSVQNLLEKWQPFLKNGRHFEFGSHFEFENVKFSLLDLKFITLSDAESFFLNFCYKRNAFSF